MRSVGLPGFAVSLSLAVGSALGLRAVAIEPFLIPSESMLPTLHPGDHLFVNKLVYGARLPWSTARLPGLRPPRRGDVVVFRASGASEHSPWLVKRIVGLPGDRVRGGDGQLWINGVPVAHWPTGELRVDGAGTPLAGWRESFDGREHGVLDDPARRAAPFELGVPERHYFVLGDNRDHSSDSRSFGPVPFEDLVGPVAFLYWSSDESTNLATPGWRLAGLARLGDRVE